MALRYENEYETWCEMLDRSMMLGTRISSGFNMVVSCSARYGTCGTTSDFMLEI